MYVRYALTDDLYQKITCWQKNVVVKINIIAGLCCMGSKLRRTLQNYAATTPTARTIQ